MTQTMDHLTPEQISAFVDAELPPGQSEEVQQHLADCHACALQVVATTQLKAATASARDRFAPPADVLARLSALQPVKQGAKPSVLMFPAISWIALAAAFLLAAILFGWRSLHEANALSAELFDQHLATLSSAASPEVISTDRHTVKPWFQGKLPFSFNLPEASSLPPDTVLRGGDLTYLDGQPAALLIFTIQKHEVSVFVMQRGSGPTNVGLPAARSGFSIRSTKTRDLRMIAVSDVNPGNLNLLLADLAQAQ